MDYELIRSRRRTLSVSISRANIVVVRAPLRLAQRDIDRFVEKHRDWIDRQLALAAERALLREQNCPSPDEMNRLRQAAREQLPPLATVWAARMNVAYTGLKVTSAATRWGSCSGKNSLCFSWRLMRLPPSLVELVVVHELCHIRVKNHSADFYHLLELYLPNYRALEKELKIKGRENW